MLEKLTRIGVRGLVAEVPADLPVDPRLRGLHLEAGRDPLRDLLLHLRVGRHILLELCLR